MARRALLAWEMGGGLGHIRRLMVVARAVEAAGFEPVIAQRTIHTLADEGREAGYPMIPIPQQVSLAPKNEPFRALTYADIMAICGYAKMDVLEPTLDAWDGLLNYIQPSVVIGDYCPILPMAVRGRYPYLAFGDGFVVPPHDPPVFPPLRAHGAPIKPVDEITSDVNALLTKRGQPQVERLGQLVAGDAQVITTLPELDIYNDSRKQKAAGPLDELPAVRPIPAEPKLFIYLAADFNNTRKMLQAVVNAKVPAEAFIRSASPELRDALRKAGMIVHDTPPPLEERLREATVVLHHGGMGTLETALAMGCAQLLLPRHLEQSLNSRNLKARKIAEMIQGEDIDEYARLVKLGLAATDWHKRVHKLATQLDKRRPFSCLETVVQTVEKLAV